MKITAMTQDEQKKLAGTHAVDSLVERGLIRSGMKIGLGTGSTAIHGVKRLAELIQAGKLTDVRAVVTSFQTGIACEDWGIPVYSLNARGIAGTLDLTIDGADEIDGENRLIKGGGAALLREKIAAYNSKRFVVIADESKFVKHLGTAFALPVEAVEEARTSVAARLAELGAVCTLREGVRKAGPVITDSGNIILDCLWKEPVDSAALEKDINAIVGVVENGFFTQNRPLVFGARSDGTVFER
ncbi:MAG: ribose-5-phosphate isomerase RpiA [Spirochaetaceae bacterium]|jgi:ribose 5-phosphate isomerase A|nr:ribose-5-phosphate isomerase RpiA [Spirochaetaceae bacterium]